MNFGGTILGGTKENGDNQMKRRARNNFASLNRISRADGKVLTRGVRPFELRG